MFKNFKFNIGITLIVQSISFVILFFMLYRKKRSLANTFLALSAIGGAAGAYLVLTEAKKELDACEQAALDACDCCCGDDDFDFDECECCYGDCSECSGEPNEQCECDITVEDASTSDSEDTPENLDIPVEDAFEQE